MRRVLLTLLALLGLLTACSSTGTTSRADVLAEHGLAGKSTAQIIDTLDALPVAERPADLTASVRVDELVVTDAAGDETSLPMPSDRFYLSFAPYVKSTHDCYYHSLTTCKGELGNRDLAVTVLDDSGRVLIDKTVTAFDNGFVGLWLPRGIKGTIRVGYDGYAGETSFGTGSEDPTCLTTLRLT